MNQHRRLAPLALALVASFLGGCGDDGGGSSSADAGVDAGIPTTSPSKRSDIKGAMDPATGAFAVFGGDDGPIVNQTPMASYRDDTWMFTPDQGWEEVTAAGPSARGRHAVAYDPNARRMLIFGGRYRVTGGGGDYTLFNDLWAFDFDAKTWTLVNDGAGGPSPRYFATAAYDVGTDTFYVFGGDTNPSALGITLSQEVWAYSGGAWSQVTTNGQAPTPARLFMAYTYDSMRNRLLAYGGQVGDFVSAANRDLYALDLASGTWSLLSDGLTGPEGRFSALMTYDAGNDRYIVMGGHADPGVANDVWAYDPAGGGWTELSAGDTFTGAALGCLNNPREIPKGYVTEDLASPERRSGGFLGYSMDSLWLFGGESDCSDHLNDTWRFDLETNTWSEIIGATSGESCARQNNDCQCLCL